MNARQTRILFQNRTVLFRRLIPLALHFECFRIELMRLQGIRGEGG